MNPVTRRSGFAVGSPVGRVSCSLRHWITIACAVVHLCSGKKDVSYTNRLGYTTLPSITKEETMAWNCVARGRFDFAQDRHLQAGRILVR